MLTMLTMWTCWRSHREGQHHIHVVEESMPGASHNFIHQRASRDIESLPNASKSTSKLPRGLDTMPILNPLQISRPPIRAILAKSVHVSSIAVAFRFALLVLGRVAHTLLT